MRHFKFGQRLWYRLGIILASPIVLFLLLASLIYLPPVQRFLKDKATTWLSEKTDTKITIDNVRLSFPLDLCLNGTTAVAGHDTLLDARSLRLGVRILPLFSGTIALDGLDLQATKINTANHLSSTLIKGYVGRLRIDVPAEYSISTNVIELGSIKLHDSNISVILSDSAQEDTTEEKSEGMTIDVRLADIQRTGIYLQLPGDSMRLQAYITKGTAKEINADIGQNCYGVKEIRLDKWTIRYDIPYELYQADRMDFNHIAISDLCLRADSISYCHDRLQTYIATLSLKEQSGFQIDNLSGHIAYDSTHLIVPDLFFKTPQSQLTARANISLDALTPGGKGKMDIFLEGNIGRKDVICLAGNSIKDHLEYYPDEPLNIKAHLTGNADRAEVKELEARLGNELSLSVKGVIKNLLASNIDTDLDYTLKGGNLSHYRNLLPDGVKIPAQFLLSGKYRMNGDNMMVDSRIHSGNGWLDIAGKINLKTLMYDLLLKANHFPLKSYLPSLPFSPLTATSHLRGNGFDFNSPKTTLESKTAIIQLAYDKIPLNNIQLNADLANRQMEGLLTGDNNMLTANTSFTANFSQKDIKARIKGRVENLALEHLTEGSDSTHLMMNIKMGGHALLDGSSIGVVGLLEHVNIITSTAGYPADSIGFRLGTSRDSTYAFVRSGDLLASFFSPTGLDSIGNGISRFIDHLKQQFNEAKLDHITLRHDLPNLTMHIKAGHQNPVARMLSLKGYSFDQIKMDLSSVQEEGLNGEMTMKSFRTGSLILDKSVATISQDTSNLKIGCEITNSSKKNPNRFAAKFNGELLSNGFVVSSEFRDAKNIEGLNVGIKGELNENHNITIHLFPEVSTIAYRKFKVNKDNYITLMPNGTLLADVDLLADDQTGMKIDASQKNSVNDITLSLSRVNIDELCGAFPYLPKMSGLLSGDFHVIRQDSSLSASGNVELNKFRYETYNIGDIGAEVVFLPKSENEYYLNALILSDDKEVANFDGTYFSRADGELDAVINLEKFPCKLLGAFLPSDGTLALDGHANGSITVTGPTSSLTFNGDILPDSLHVLSPLYGINLSMEDKPLRIRESCIYLDTLTMYSVKSSNPLTVNGNVNFSNLDKITMDIAVKAKDFQIVNSERTKTSLLFGKVYSDIDATIKGSTNFMFIKGKLHILGKTDMTYIMKDSPLTVEEWLSGLVEFVDFSDTTTVEKEKTETSKMLMSMDIKIDETSKIRCELSADGNSYFNCKGGGNLTMKYLPSGDLNLIGTFRLKDGEMKYELPFIPLKTFKLTDENYITFTGKPFNPTLNIKAMETTRASVNDGASTTRMVTFNVGVAITQTLENMGLQFLIEAPNDMNVQNDLASMSKEEKNKVAITMLATGMYYSASNKSTFKANNALNAFLQSEIQNLAGNALKTIDLTVGMDGSTTASGNAQTDYSFRFSKHLWNDKVTFVIGGKVSAGAEDSKRNQSFIDNISLEYRLDKNANRNLRLFYVNDTQDPLEGSLSTAGGGYVLRSKTNSLGELFLKPRRKTKDEKPH